MKNKKDSILITEMFMATAGGDFSRCFYGNIHRETDAHGRPIVYGKISIGDGHIIASARDQWELGERLDQLVLMILDYDLNASAGKRTIITGTPIFHN
jgi:hypothetical protein